MLRQCFFAAQCKQQRRRGWAAAAIMWDADNLKLGPSVCQPKQQHVVLTKNILKGTKPNKKSLFYPICFPFSCKITGNYQPSYRIVLKLSQAAYHCCAAWATTSYLSLSTSQISPEKDDKTSQSSAGKFLASGSTAAQMQSGIKLQRKN